MSAIPSAKMPKSIPKLNPPEVEDMIASKQAIISLVEIKKKTDDFVLNMGNVNPEIDNRLRYIEQSITMAVQATPISLIPLKFSDDNIVYSNIISIEEIGTLSSTEIITMDFNSIPEYVTNLQQMGFTFISRLSGKIIKIKENYNFIIIHLRNDRSCVTFGQVQDNTIKE